MKTLVRISICLLAVGLVTVFLTVGLVGFERKETILQRSVVPGGVDTSLHSTACCASYETSTHTRQVSLATTPIPAGASHLQIPETQVQQFNNCCNISKGVDVEPFCNGSDTLSLRGCKCVDVLLCRMVAVTSLSSNHFAEAQDNFGSLQKYFPRTKIIVYDLGLTESERRQLTTYCNVELRNFPFEKYPDHVRDLVTYAWKPLVVSEVAREYEVILYGDTSVRMKSSDMATVLNSIVRFPFVSGIPHSQPIVSLTHDGTLEYLHAPSRKELANFIGTQGGVWLMWANSMMKARVIDAWVDCGLNKRCIAPEGAAHGPCNFTQASFSVGNYVGCHRYDQSALNMIIAREFGPSVSPLISSWSLSNLMWVLKRKATHDFEIQTCNGGGRQSLL